MGAEFHHDLLTDGLPPAEVEAQVERSRQRIRQAPVAVMLCMDPFACDYYPDPKRREAEQLMVVQSVALAGAYLLLAAQAEGLSSVWICAPLFAPLAARQALDLPDDWQPQALLLIGYPDHIPDPRPRLPLEEVARVF
jgi:coenzyme F420-0:L-glutamate ligase / coenzyme F420-1:gamma-L-glutamate ligase